MSVAESQDQYDFDPDALREKYREERDKRVRADGNDQYIEVTGDFSHYVDDPYVEPGFVRDPVLEEVEVVVIGGGFGGMLAAARLKDAGIHDVRIIEKGEASVVPGTGIGTPGRPATLNPMFTFRCWRKRGLCLVKNTRMRQRRLNTAKS